jgi:redox-regulated HSP33 family molecular chaperone
MEYKKILEEREKRAAVIAHISAVLDAALADKALPHTIDATLSELLVLGLLRQGSEHISRCSVTVHEIGEVLRIYARADSEVFGSTITRSRLRIRQQH